MFRPFWIIRNFFSVFSRNSTILAQWFYLVASPFSFFFLNLKRILLAYPCSRTGRKTNTTWSQIVMRGRCWIFSSLALISLAVIGEPATDFCSNLPGLVRFFCPWLIRDDLDIYLRVSREVDPKFFQLLIIKDVSRSPSSKFQTVVWKKRYYSIKVYFC